MHPTPNYLLPHQGPNGRFVMKAQHLLSSSSIDWCEPNYVMTHYIAEFWNTISSFLIVVMAFWPRKSTWMSTYFRMGLGLGSVLFHGTLTYGGQICDELFMVYYVQYLLYRLYPQVLMRVLSTTLTLGYTWHALPISGPYAFPAYQFHIFQSIFISMCLVGLVKAYQTLGSLRDFRQGIVLLGLGYLFWHADHLLCTSLGHLGCHAMWHILSSFSLYYLEKSMENISF